MNQDLSRDILGDYGYFYLGTVIDGARNRGIGKMVGAAPMVVKHVIYMQDTNLMLSIDPNHKLVGPEELREVVRDPVNSREDIYYHEIGSVVAGILSGDMSYLDWLCLPIINQPEPEYINTMFVELGVNLSDCYLALVARAKIAPIVSWMPLDYRAAQFLAFARTGKIEVNYFTALAHLQEDTRDYEVYESATDEIRFERLARELRSIETKARRGIL